MDILSTNIYKHRMEQNLTQTQLAEKLAVSSKMVSRWERGTPPCVKNLILLADIFDISLDELTGRGERSTQRISFECSTEVVNMLDEICNTLKSTRSEFLISSISAQYDNMHGNEKLKSVIELFGLANEKLKMLDGK